MKHKLTFGERCTPQKNTVSPSSYTSIFISVVDLPQNDSSNDFLIIALFFNFKASPKMRQNVLRKRKSRTKKEEMTNIEATMKYFKLKRSLEKILLCSIIQKMFQLKQMRRRRETFQDFTIMNSKRSPQRRLKLIQFHASKVR